MSEQQEGLSEIQAAWRAWEAKERAGQTARAPLGAVEAGEEDAAPALAGQSSSGSSGLTKPPPTPAPALAVVLQPPGLESTASALAEQHGAADEPSRKPPALAEQSGAVVEPVEPVSPAPSEQEGAVAAPVVATVEQISSLREVGQKPPPVERAQHCAQVPPRLE